MTTTFEFLYTTKDEKGQILAHMAIVETLAKRNITPQSLRDAKKAGQKPILREGVIPMTLDQLDQEIAKLEKLMENENAN